MNYNQKVKNKCEALLNLIIGIQPFYHKSNNETKGFIETTIGAAIFYLPKKNSVLFTGKISKEALSKNEKSEDHLYPRKIAASELLDIKWDKKKDPIQSLANLFIEKYGKYNYVSKSENKKLIKYQKIGVFNSPEKAYQSAGIELIDYEGFLNF